MQIPGFQVDRLEPIETGWDSFVVEVNGEWIFRFPRRPEVIGWLRKEAELLPELAPTLPVRVPSFEFTAFGDTPFVGYRKLDGQRLDAALARGADEAALGRQAHGFLKALHRFPVERARVLSVRGGGADDWFDKYRKLIQQLEERVVPMLADEERRRAEVLFGELFVTGRSFTPALVHADLGPGHILCDGSQISAVLDWSDARIGDPAIDYSWLLHGTKPQFARELRADADLAGRALFYHRLGPWYEVVYGLDESRPELVDSGLQGIRARLPD